MNIPNNETNHETVSGRMHPLVSLDEWNENRQPTTPTKYPKPNGIACPECGAEMYDTDSVELMSNPPKRNIHCGSCALHTYRNA